MEDAKNMSLFSDTNDAERKNRMDTWVCSLNKLYASKADSESFIEVLPQTPDDVLECFAYLCNNQLDARMMLNQMKVWFIYLKSIADERFIVALDFISEVGSNTDLFLYLRAMYRFGYSVISDPDYDALLKIYTSWYPELGFLTHQTADDDLYNGVVKSAVDMSIPRESSRKGSKTVQLSTENSAAFQDLNDEKSTSIRPVESWEDVYDFVWSVPTCDLFISLKVDGINTKVMFAEDGSGLELALSRGRASDSFDYTEAIRAEIRLNGIAEDKLSGKITGESFVSLSGIDALNAKYPDRNYKTPKSAGSAMLRAPQKFDDADLTMLRTLFFSIDGKLSVDAYAEMEAAGLSVPPHFTVKRSEIPRDSSVFKNWLFDSILNKMFELGDGLPSDGVVVELMANINTERKDVYSDSNIAIKFGPWAAAEYESVVTGIEVEQKRIEASVVLIIEPVITRDYNTATRVGGISTSMLIADGVKVGSRIKFVRKSEAYNTYVECLD